MGRILKHLIFPRWRVRRVFPKAALKAIEAAVKDSEKSHTGELRFVVEGCLELPDLLRGVTARQRAARVFSRLGMGNTQHASGVLIYLQIADRQIEILADRGIDAKVGALTWQRICADMEEAFRCGRFEEGAIRGVQAVGKVLAEHFPPQGGNPDELSNDAVVL